MASRITIRGMALAIGTMAAGLTAVVSSAEPAAGRGRDPAAAPEARLHGFVDMHTHPMVHLAFGGKLVHGAPDVGSLLPVDADCRHWVRATSMAHALGPDAGTHGAWSFANPCGDTIRQQVIRTMQAGNRAAVTPDRARGAGAFADWPRWDDITHQKMWVDWIRQAHRGGLRVMVALATNNRTLADAVAGPGDGPTDNKASADLQLTELKAFVGRHDDFMAVAYTPDDLQRIVAAGKLAVVLGVEIDDIGNFNREPELTPAKVEAELDRLVAQGVRYLFPIHVVDNPFGGTAVYEDAFNLANFRETGHYWDLEPAEEADGIGWRFRPAGFDPAVGLIKAIKLGVDPFSRPPEPPAGPGHRNRRGLTPLGEAALQAMMRRGLLIDIDHMSQKAANRALDLAEAVPGGYPLNSGHNGLRGTGSSENARTETQLRRLAGLQGMVGVGNEATDAHTWLRHYERVVQVMGGRGTAVGTDTNGLVQGPKPRPGSQIVYDDLRPASHSGSRVWDYNRDGVAHYGLLGDWVRDMRTAPGGAALVDKHLMRSADDFWRTWRRAESQRRHVP